MAREAVGDKENRAQLGKELQSRDRGLGVGGWRQRDSLARWRQPNQDVPVGVGRRHDGDAPKILTLPAWRWSKSLDMPPGAVPAPPWHTLYPRPEITPTQSGLSQPGEPSQAYPAPMGPFSTWAGEPPACINVTKAPPTHTHTLEAFLAPHHSWEKIQTAPSQLSPLPTFYHLTPHQLPHPPPVMQPQDLCSCCYLNGGPQKGLSTQSL